VASRSTPLWRRDDERRGLLPALESWRHRRRCNHDTPEGNALLTFPRREDAEDYRDELPERFDGVEPAALPLDKIASTCLAYGLEVLASLGSTNSESEEISYVSVVELFAE
jgi:hypothetical protein